MRSVLIFLATILLISRPAISQVKQEKGVGESICVSQEEMILFNLVNDLRKQNKLPVIPLSGSLCIVSKTHIENLLTWKPQESGCNLNSWTAGSNWSACCSNKDPRGSRCMNDKPSEITGYSGKGYELVYWQEEPASAFDAFDLWKQVQASREMILGKGKWQSKEWKAMGIGIGQGYAVLWMGDKADRSMNISICGADTLLQTYIVPTETIKVVKSDPPAGKKQTGQPSVSTDPYYIIVASLKLEEQASERLAELRSAGYTDAMIIKSADRFRVSLGSYATEAKAKARMKELKADFPDCWLLRLNK